MKVNLYELSGAIDWYSRRYEDCYLNTCTGEIVTKIISDTQSIHFLKLPTISPREWDMEFIETIENVYIRNSLISNYGHADIDKYFKRFLENNCDIDFLYEEFIDKKALETAKKWAEENNIDYYIEE